MDLIEYAMPPKIMMERVEGECSKYKEKIEQRGTETEERKENVHTMQLQLDEKIGQLRSMEEEALK